MPTTDRWLAASLAALSRSRSVFHSEADLQHALAWQVRSEHPDAGVRLEVPSRTGPGREAVDLVVLWPGGRSTAIELKYPKARWEGVIHGEHFSLPTTSAHDIVRYDVVKDLARLERWVAGGEGRDGFVVALTNDPAYWRPPAAPARTIDADFRLHDGVMLTGRLSWGPGAGASTMRGREADVDLVGRYEVRWRPFSVLTGSGRTEMRVLVLHVDLPAGAVPPVDAPTDPVERAVPLGQPAARSERTIWQKLEHCVAQLSEPFARQEIVSWFRRHEPDVNEASLGAHIQAATHGRASGPFANRAPLLERIDRGLYRRYRPSSAEPARQPDPADRRLLEQQFDADVRRVVERARLETGYHAGGLLRMLRARGGTATARALLSSNSTVSDGFVALMERGRLDLTVEALVLEPRYAWLFDDAAREVARARLGKWG